jgi:hypothetical protein
MAEHEITADEAIALAKSYNQSGNAVGQFRLKYWDQMSDEQRLVLGNIANSLFDHSQDLTTYAAGKILDDTQSSLDQIQKATAQANQVIQRINGVKKVITIGTALVSLGAAIYSENPSGIANALQGVISAVGNGGEN